jgi:hypothetical protein
MVQKNFGLKIITTRDFIIHEDAEKILEHGVERLKIYGNFV